MRDSQEIMKELDEWWAKYKAALDALADRAGETGRGDIYEGAVNARDEIDRLHRELAERLGIGGS